MFVAASNLNSGYDLDQFQFNVSLSKLVVGPIPESLSSKPVSSFEGNSSSGKPVLLCNATSNSNRISNTFSGGAGIVVVVIIGCFIGCLCQRKRIKRREQVEISVAGSGVAAADGEGNKGLVLCGDVQEVFHLEDVLKSPAEVLGKGTYGTTYKATLENIGTPLVVKRLRDVKVSEEKFREMFDLVGKINHENLLPLRAYHCHKDGKFLVYDYMPKGSLSALLQGNRDVGNTKKIPLNWHTRFDIALGVARAIAVLHSQGPGTSHGNIKASNILLTKTLEARVSDFLSDYNLEPNPYPRRINGYRAPEVTDSRRKVSQKVDVYSFGVLLLELLTGKAPFVKVKLTWKEVNLRSWILNVVENELTSEVFELDLLRYENVEEDLVRTLQVAIDCTDQNPRNRPSMEEVRTQMEEFRRFNSRVNEIRIDVEDDKSSIPKHSNHLVNSDM